MSTAHSRRWLVAALLLAAGTFGARVAAEPAGPISADAIRRHTVVLGSDAYAGRAPGTPGGELAAAYLVRNLAEIGLEPAPGLAGFRQQVPLHASLPLPSCQLELWRLGVSRELELGDDYLLFTTGSQTLIPRRVPLVFVGYGIVAPEFDHNDYQEVDVRGRVAVYLAGEPASRDPRYFDGERPTVYSSPETKKRIALSRGAVGSILIPPPSDDVDADWQRTRREFAFEDLSLAYALPGHLSMLLHPAVAEWLFDRGLYDFGQVLGMERRHALRSFHLPVELRFEGRFFSRDVLAPNVVAVLPGADPELRASFVVVSAHYDHLGVGPAVAGDAIYNGVVDNALGVAGVLEIARVLAERPRRPRRSVLFLLSTAEEKGLLGSRYFLDHPPVEVARMAANINVDGLAFLDDFSDVVGIGGELSDLGVMLARAVRPLGLQVATPPSKIWSADAYARSEQVAFAEAGVPAILVNEGFSWRHATSDEAVAATVAWFRDRYHAPSDDLAQPLDFEAAARHAAAVLALVLEVADARQPPQWRPGVPYAYQRLLSQAGGR